MERIDLVERWRLRLKEVLQDARKTLEDSAGVVVNIAHDVATLLEEQDQLVLKADHLTHFLTKERKKMMMVLEVAKVHGLRASRCGWISKDWLASADGGDFMARLSGEMINNGNLLEAEAHRLTAVELGYDMEKLASLAKEKRADACSNMAVVLSQESATMNDASWDSDEQKQWSEKVDTEKEKRALDLDLDFVSFGAPSVPVTYGRKTFSSLETKCFDLTNVLRPSRGIGRSGTIGD